MSKTISISLPDTLSEMLENISKTEERTKSYYIKKALENYFLQKLENEEDYKDVIDSLTEFKINGEKGKSWEELQKELDL